MRISMWKLSMVALACGILISPTVSTSSEPKQQKIRLKTVDSYIYRFLVPARKSFCLFKDGFKGIRLIYDFAVLDSDSDTPDIDFYVTENPDSPSEHKWPAGRHANTTGHINIPLGTTYNNTLRFCWDNTFSMMSYKVVEVRIRDLADASHPEFSAKNDPYPELAYDISVVTILYHLDTVKLNVENTTQYQSDHKQNEKRGRSLVEHQNERINFWSFLFLTSQILVSIAQVIAVKWFFDIEKRFSIWRWWKHG